MRLARTASPLPRSLPGWNRTSGLRFPKPAGWPSPPQAEADKKYPRRESNPPFPVESRTSSPLDHGGMNYVGSRRPWNRTRPCSLSASRAAADTGLRRTDSSGSRARTCASRLTVARLAARPHRNGRCSGRRGSRTPEARRPTRFRDGIPRRTAVLPKGGSGRRRTCTPPIKSRQLCRIELRSRVMMWPAGVEPAARRVSGGRSTGLSYGHERLERLKR